MGWSYNYIYTQPSQSESYGLKDSDDDGYSETKAAIVQDQAEIEAARRQYPPQPKVEFGFPQSCYCGANPVVATSRNEPGRRYYTCENVDDGDCHVWKWWDVAVMEEMGAMDSQYAQLCQKVDALNLISDDETHIRQLKEQVSETEQRLVRIERIVSDLGNKNSLVCSFECVVGAIVLFLIVAGMVLMFK